MALCFHGDNFTKTAGLAMEISTGSLHFSLIILQDQCVYIYMKCDPTQHIDSTASGSQALCLGSALSLVAFLKNGQSLLCGSSYKHAALSLYCEMREVVATAFPSSLCCSLFQTDLPIVPQISANIGRRERNVEQGRASQH